MTVAASAISVSNIWKSFRLYHERNRSLKATILKGRRARFEEFWALKGLSFDVPTGSTLGVIGSNGSGKSTLLKCMCEVLEPEKGYVSTTGRVSALLELGAGFHPELSGRQNVFLNGAILGLSRREIAARFDDIVEFAGLEQFIDTPMKNYSSGMFVRLGFAVAAHVDPEVLLIDEILSVGDEMFQRKSAERVEQFRREGRTIVFVSHGLAQVEQLCETAAWIDRGELRMLGPAADVISAYQGQSHGARQDIGELGQRWGSGEIVITKVRFLDESGDSVVTPTTMSPLTIAIELDAHVPIQDAVVTIGIDTLAGHPVWRSSTRRNQLSLGLITGTAQVEIGIPQFPLLEGIYDLTVAVTDQTEMHAFDHWDKKIRFDVRQFSVHDAGVVRISASWRATGTKTTVEGQGCQS